MGNIPRKFLCFCLRFEDLLATATVPCNNLNLERQTNYVCFYERSRNSPSAQSS
jgi:hypothetical protein